MPHLEWDHRLLGSAKAFASAGARPAWLIASRLCDDVLRIELSGWLERQAYRELASQLQDTYTSAKSVRLYLDSEGGGLGGLSRATQSIEHRKQPVTAFVTRRAIGAAYLLALSCKGIVCHPLALVGLGEVENLDGPTEAMTQHLNAEVARLRPAATASPFPSRNAEQAEAYGFVDLLYASL